MWPFHKHIWAEVDRQFTEFIYGGGAITLLTYRCVCGEYRQKRLDGHVKEG